MAHPTYGIADARSFSIILLRFMDSPALFTSRLHRQLRFKAEKSYFPMQKVLEKLEVNRLSLETTFSSRRAFPS